MLQQRSLPVSEITVLVVGPAEPKPVQGCEVFCQHCYAPLGHEVTLPNGEKRLRLSLAGGGALLVSYYHGECGTCYRPLHWTRTAGHPLLSR